MARVPASEATRKRIEAMISGEGERVDKSERVRAAARLMVEEVLEEEVTDALGRDFYGARHAPIACQEDRVDTHKNAPMTPVGRLRMVEAVLAGETIQAVAQRGRTDRKTVRKWLNRYRAEGAAGLCDRSSRPRHSPKAIARGSAQRVITLRQRRWTMASIAAELRLSRATVSRVLARAGLSRLAALDPAPLPRR